MSSTAVTLLIAGAANLLPALFFMFTALLGSNGMNSAQGGKLLGTLAVLLVLGWLAALWLARHLAHWGQARGWSTVASVAAASGWCRRAAAGPGPHRCPAAAGPARHG